MIQLDNKAGFKDFDDLDIRLGMVVGRAVFSLGTLYL